MNRHSATAKHDADVLEYPLLTGTTTRNMGEACSLRWSIRWASAAENTFQYVKLYIRDFQKSLSLRSVADSGSFGEPMLRNFKWFS